MSDPTGIRGWQRLSPRITTSGRIEDGDLPRLAEIGTCHVINLALADHPEALADEAEKLAHEGIDYTHIPVPFDAPGEEHYRAFVDALTGGETPVHVHCIMNWRVSAFLCRYNIENGMDASQARGQMEQIWSPDENDHKDAPTWAAFVRGEER